MNEKPKIQYIGQFYIHGSEALKLQEKQKQRRAKTRLPLERLSQIEKIYLDPVATVAIAVAVVMLVVMVLGTVQIYDDWAQYQTVLEYTSDLKAENARLTTAYHAGYDLEAIRVQAVGLGLVPIDQVPVKNITVTIPVPEPEPTWMEEVQWFWNGLWA